MSLNRDQFAVVLASLRRRFRAGEWVEGEPLQVGDLAEQCGVSATPIREALSRLAGEGLVEDRRGRGYQARRPDGVELADLYRMQQALADIAAGGRGAGSAARVILSPEAFIDDPVSTWEALFDAMMLQASSGFLMSQQRRLADQLAPARRAEPRVLGETAQGEFAPLTEAVASADWPVVMLRLEPFFRRRRDSVEALVASMRLDARKYKTTI